MLKTSGVVSNFSKVLLLILVLFLFLSIAVVNDPHYVSSAISSKFIFILYICGLLFLFYNLSIFCAKTRKKYVSRLDIFLFALVLYITFNRYILQCKFGFSIRYLELVCLSFLYIVFRSLSVKSYIWIFLAIVFSGIVQAFYGTFQLFGLCLSNHLVFRITGSFFNPGPFAGYLVSIWPIALGMYLFKEKLIILAKSHRVSSFSYVRTAIELLFEYIPMIGIFSIAIILPCTKSRASWIAFVISTLVLVECRYNFFKRVGGIRKICLAFIALAFLAAGALGLYNLKKSSSDGRIFIGKIATEMIADKPFFGFGIDGFKAHYMIYQARYFAINKKADEAMVADNTLYAFNDWLQFVVENGLIGVLFLIAVFYAISKIKNNHKRTAEFLIARIGLLAIGVFACFSYPMQILPIKVILVFFIAIIASENQILCSFNSSQSKAKKNIIVFVCSSCTVILFYYARCLDRGFIIWRNAVEKYQFGDYSGSVEDYNSVYFIFENDGTFLMNFGKTLAKAGDHRKAITILEKAERYLNNTIISITIGDSRKALKQFRQSEIYYLTAANMVPAQFYPDFLLCRLYTESKQTDKAKLMAKKILEKKIKVHSPAIYKIRKEMKNLLMKH